MSLQIGDAAPAFSLPAVDGHTYTYDDVKGAKGTAILFWCNHCPFVQGSEARLVQIVSEYGGQGVGFAAINANSPEVHAEDDFPHMVARAKAQGYNFAYLQDESQDVARRFGAQRTPEAYLFDADGALRYHGRIDNNPQDERAANVHDLRHALDALLAGNAPDPAETGAIGCTIKWK